MKRKVVLILLFIIAVSQKSLLYAIQDSTQKNKQNDDIVSSVAMSFYAGAGFLYCMNDLDVIADYGFGGFGGVIFHNLIFDGSAIDISGGYYSYHTTHEAVTGLTDYKGGLFLGYTAFDSKFIEITPFIGSGYFIHNLQGDDPDYNYGYFSDPYVALRLDCAFYLAEKFTVRVMPEYDLYFEQYDKMGGCLSIQVAAGYKINFTSSKPEETSNEVIYRTKARGKIKLSTTGLTFKPDLAILVDDTETDRKRNEKLLNQLTDAIKEHSEYSVTIIGHAVNIYSDDPVKAAEEEIKLKVLSKKRADLIKSLLVKRGIKASRIDTKGAGGTQPVSPFSNILNRWKNRRIEVILEK